MTTLQDTLKLGSLSVPSRIFMVTRPRIFLHSHLQSGLHASRDVTAFIHAGAAHALPRGPRHEPAERLDEAVLRPARVGRTRHHGVHEHRHPKADLFYTGKVGDLTYTGPEGYTDYPTLP